MALQRSFPSRIVNQLLVAHPGFVHQWMNSNGDDPALWKTLESLEISPALFNHVTQQFSQQTSLFDEADLKAAAALFKTLFENTQIIYLPTYRRIERDLKVLFPGLERSFQSEYRRRVSETRHERRAFIELVEFGMEDVEETLVNTKHILNSKSRNELNSLAGGYLRDVLRGEGTAYDVTLFQRLDEETISSTLNRVEENTLSEGDKERLKTIIQKLTASSHEAVDAEDRYIGHFFSKLLDVHQALSALEKSVSRFAEVCDKYLVKKYIDFDPQTYNIRVLLKHTKKELRLKDLSSGEKQIVSLFSHLYLHRQDNFVLLIDEPELSLSVAWQKLLLPDIWDSGRCVFMAAVTHSPFVFDNNLKPNATDLQKCIIEEGVAHP